MVIRHIARNTFLRLTDEDKSLLEAMAKYYGITQADMIRIALKEFARNHGFLSSSEARYYEGVRR
jgi:antitoxin component of RelBE/YafQ-DinJ toxin-antitoxin module